MSWRPRDASREQADGVVVGMNPITGKHVIREADGSVARVRLRDVVWGRREPSAAETWKPPGAKRAKGSGGTPDRPARSQPHTGKAGAPSTALGLGIRGRGAFPNGGKQGRRMLKRAREARAEGDGTAPDARRRRNGGVGNEEANMPAANPKETL